MRRGIATTFAGVVLLAVAATRGSTPAAACSTVPGYDPVAASDVIAEGLLIGRDNDLRLVVNRVYKGRLPWLVRFNWGGDSASCGLADLVKAGDYIVLGGRASHGAFGGGWPSLFYHGPGPASVGYDQPIARLRERLGPGVPPAIGIPLQHWFTKW